MTLVRGLDRVQLAEIVQAAASPITTAAEPMCVPNSKTESGLNDTSG